MSVRTVLIGFGVLWIVLMAIGAIWGKNSESGD